VAVRIRPAAAGAIKPLLLINLEECLAASHQARFVGGIFERAENGRNTPGPC
jgi:hypothetical protein